MPKASLHKKNNSNGSPYGDKTGKAKMGNSIFKMNTDLGCIHLPLSLYAPVY
jgi:hypothetical protein